MLPVDAKERKAIPIFRGFLKYFPLAIAEVTKVSVEGNNQHNPGQPLHWSKGKSNDHLDCIARHLLQAGSIDAEDGMRHSAKLAWRALANLEMELEAELASAALNPPLIGDTSPERRQAVIRVGEWFTPQPTGPRHAKPEPSND